MASLKIAGIDVAKVVDKEIPSRLENAGITLIQTAEGVRTSSSSGRPVTRTSYPGKGVVTEYEDRVIEGTLVKALAKEILVFPLTLQADGAIFPRQGDEITAEGITYHILSVKRDPAAATYTCTVR